MILRAVVTPLLFVLSLVAASARAQQPGPVGTGSYADAPPAGLVVDKKRNADLVKEVEGRKLYLVADDGRPIPSNKWYQNLIFQPYGTGLWAMPHKVDATKEGVEVFYPTTFAGDGSRSVAEFPLIATGQDFKPIDSRAKGWTHWGVSFRMFESDRRHVDVTLAEGMPFVWCEYVGVRPRIALGGIGGKGSRGKGAATFFDLSNKPATLPLTGDALGLTYEKRSYAVFAPDGTTFEQGADGIDVTFAGAAGKGYLVIAVLPSPSDIALFHQHAFALPRDTKLSWNYDRAAGTIATTWAVTAEPLKGTNRAVLQGLLPHHWRENTSGQTFTDVAYTTIRGKMKCAAGESFTIRYPFNGVLPNLPAPAANTFDAGRVKKYLADHFVGGPRGLAGDTYAGGKDLQRYAQAAFVARQVGDAAAADAVSGKLRAALENWFTYAPGERDRFFAYYPRRKGLVGFNASYGSQHFTDNHFHYGYFAYAAGMLGHMQPDFARDFGDMARLVAKQYANYDERDQRFPFLRTFDAWRGHSFADGNGFPDGNNQESTGEAVNSWVGLILLGEALGDAEMTAAGVMGYSFESRANVEYWFDPHGDVFPPAYAHDACGMIWCNSIVWGTWFTASPAWIYGIQWLPTAPHAAFYDRDRAFIKRAYAGYVREQEAFEAKEAAKKPNAPKKPVAIKSLGGELGSYHLGFLMHADPAGVVAEIDKLHAEPNDKVARDAWMGNVYYQASALRELGRVDWACHATSPTAVVYVDEQAKARTMVAWNPTPREQTVEFFRGAEAVGKLIVPAGGIAKVSVR